ncbi:MAG: hypothetical protein AMXMBFR64_16450 [Myxococcales bacterium]
MGRDDVGVGRHVAGLCRGVAGPSRHLETKGGGLDAEERHAQRLKRYHEAGSRHMEERHRGVIANLAGSAVEANRRRPGPNSDAEFGTKSPTKAPTSRPP